MQLKNVIKNRMNMLGNRMVEHYVNNATLHKGVNISDNREVKIIASLTSYSARLKSLHLCIKSILLQTKKPDRVILWLGNDVSEHDLTPEVNALCQNGLEIRFVNENLRPHKKYFYALQEFPNDIVITFDDDVYYSPFTIASLYKSHKRYPISVCARRTHKILFSKDRQVMPYMKWEFNATDCRQPSYKLFATGVGGVLYPPKAIAPIAFEVERIKEECLLADDIWLKTMEIMQGTKVVWTPCIVIIPPDIVKNSQLGLAAINVYCNKNDEYVADLDNKYHWLDAVRE